MKQCLRMNTFQVDYNIETGGTDVNVNQLRPGKQREDMYWVWKPEGKHQNY